MEQLIDFDTLAENEDIISHGKQNYISPWGNLENLNSRYSIQPNATRFRVRSLGHHTHIKPNQQSQMKITKQSSFQKESSLLQKDQEKRASIRSRMATLSCQNKYDSSEEAIPCISRIKVGEHSLHQKKIIKPYKSINIHQQFLRRLNLPGYRINLRLENTHLPMLTIISLNGNSNDDLKKNP